MISKSIMPMSVFAALVLGLASSNPRVSDGWAEVTACTYRSSAVVAPASSSSRTQSSTGVEEESSKCTYTP